MNKSQGHMYDWVRTVNPLGGQCRHDCIYCYVKILKKRATAIFNKYSGHPTLWKPELKKGLGEGYTVFVCSMSDLFADNVPGEIIRKILLSNAPEPPERAKAFSEIPDNGFKRTVTIEPVMDFNHDIFIEMIKATRPDWVNIGADSKNFIENSKTKESIKNGLPEPTREKVLQLVSDLGTFTEVREKNNLGRLRR